MDVAAASVLAAFRRAASPSEVCTCTKALHQGRCFVQNRICKALETFGICLTLPHCGGLGGAFVILLGGFVYSDYLCWPAERVERSFTNLFTET